MMMIIWWSVLLLLLLLLLPLSSSICLFFIFKSRYGPPRNTEYRVIVENLSSRVSWQVCLSFFLFCFCFPFVSPIKKFLTHPFLHFSPISYLYIISLYISLSCPFVCHIVFCSFLLSVYLKLCWVGLSRSLFSLYISWHTYRNTHTHTHTHTYIYIYSIFATGCYSFGLFIICVVKYCWFNFLLFHKSSIS